MSMIYSMNGELTIVTKPSGFDGNGLPLAFQLIAPAFAEAKLYQVAEAYEAATTWHQTQPQFLSV